MVFKESGTLTTDEREVAISETWDTQTDWEAYQSKSGITITNGVLELAELSIVDDFEDGDLSEYSGDTGGFTTQTSVVYEGTYALQGQSGSGGGANAISSTSGLANYPSEGTTSEVRLYIDTDGSGGHNPIIQFGYQDSSNRYLVSLSESSSTLEFSEDVSGSSSTLGSESVNIGNYESEWLLVRIDWASGGTFTITLLDSSGTQLAQISTTSTTFTSGGIGFFVNNQEGTTSTMYFDYWVY